MTVIQFFSINKLLLPTCSVVWQNYIAGCYRTMAVTHPYEIETQNSPEQKQKSYLNVTHSVRIPIRNFQTVCLDQWVCEEETAAHVSGLSAFLQTTVSPHTIACHMTNQRGVIFTHAPVCVTTYQNPQISLQINHSFYIWRKICHACHLHDISRLDCMISSSH